MEYRKQGLSFAETGAIDMVSFLAGLGYQPARIRGNDCWYLFPLRKENTPSLKVITRINRWYDFGLGAGGSLIDFGMAYYGSEFMKQLQSELVLSPVLFIFSTQNKSAENKIVILESTPLISSSLVRYLDYRMIPLSIARTHCTEIKYRVGERSYFAIGFQNDAGGYELRSPRFKGSSSPKKFRHIRNGQSSLCVFEGFFDFLSFLVLHPNLVSAHDYLILNSLSIFEIARSVMEQYASVLLFLDNDPAGRSASAYAISVSSCYQDQGRLYEGYEDLNDFLCSKPIPDNDTSLRSVRPP